MPGLAADTSIDDGRNDALAAVRYLDLLAADGIAPPHVLRRGTWVGPEKGLRNSENQLVIRIPISAGAQADIEPCLRRTISLCLIAR